MLLVVAGPSGVGKGTIVQELVRRRPSFWISVSAATRPPRHNEVDGIDYHFISREQFERDRDEGKFLEWFEVFGDLKGTPREPLEAHLAAGDDVLLELDVKGALAIRKQMPEAVLVFVKPPSRDEQRRRLEARGTDTPEAIERRLDGAEAEEAVAAASFDAIIVNDDVGTAVDQLTAILETRR
ncbi:MAG: guanylate kinase [Actinomycetia bacterium]|nr:guanylate kinase [Actinomycetes bacterium]